MLCSPTLSDKREAAAMLLEALLGVAVLDDVGIGAHGLRYVVHLAVPCGVDVMGDIHQLAASVVDMDGIGDNLTAFACHHFEATHFVRGVVGSKGVGNIEQLLVVAHGGSLGGRTGLCSSGVGGHLARCGFDSRCRRSGCRLCRHSGGDDILCGMTTLGGDIGGVDADKLSACLTNGRG